MRTQFFTQFLKIQDWGSTSELDEVRNFGTSKWSVMQSDVEINFEDNKCKWEDFEI